MTDIEDVRYWDADFNQISEADEAVWITRDASTHYRTFVKKGDHP